MYTIYRVVCAVTQKCYVGKTHDTKKRKRGHFMDLSQSRHHSRKLQDAYNEYSKETFSFEVLETGLLEPLASERETYWISHFDSYENGFNITPNGEGSLIHPRPCIFNGVKYNTIAEAATALGVSANALSKRLDGILTGEIKPRPFTVPCNWNGENFKSITEAARVCGVSITTMRERIQKGYTCDADVSVKDGLVKRRFRPCSWNGVQYPTIVAASIANNIPSKRMQKYLKKGYTGDADLP